MMCVAVFQTKTLRYAGKTTSKRSIYCIHLGKSFAFSLIS